VDIDRPLAHDGCRRKKILKAAITTEQVAQDIGEGRWQKYGQVFVFDDCEEDVARTTDLLRRMIRGKNFFTPIPVKQIFSWSEYRAKCVAKS
jgi:hypothetical protein